MNKEQLEQVEKLTPDQTQYTPKQLEAMEYMRKVWTKIGVDPTDPPIETIEEIVNEFRTEVMECPVAPVKLFSNPLETWDAVCLMIEDEKWGDCTEDEIREEIKRRDAENIEFRISPRVAPHMFGSLDAGSIGFYSFFVDCLKVDIDDNVRRKLEAWKKTAQVGMFYLLDKMSCVCKKPKHIYLNDDERLHSESGKALEFEGGVGYFALNGVPVPEELAITPAENLNIDFFLHEKNADVKAEFVRKFGVERMASFGKLVDSYVNYDQEEQPWWWKSEYELWDMEALFDGLDYQPYLKMLNQTTGIWHMEAVSPDCRTLVDAIKERFGGRDMKIASIS